MLAWELTKGHKAIAFYQFSEFFRHYIFYINCKIFRLYKCNAVSVKYNVHKTIQLTLTLWNIVCQKMTINPWKMVKKRF